MIRSRSFAFIVYPDSTCYDYKGLLSALSRLGVACAVSPLHVPDSDTKKPHYHILLTFDGVKSIESLENLTDIVTGDLFDFKKICNFFNIGKSDFPHFMIVNSVCGYYRYLIHLDNIDKQQFDNYKISCGYEGLTDKDKYNTIVHLSGFNNRDYLERDKKISMDYQLINVIEENNIQTEHDLIFFLSKNQNNSLLDYVHKNIYFVKTFIFSEWSREQIKRSKELIQKKVKEVQEEELKQFDFSDDIPLESWETEL